MKYTPEQHKAIVTTGQHISVSAGAGSGKTRVLVDRIVHLLEHEGTALSEIVAITFTRKAASEMKERLREACYAKAPDDDAQAMSRWRDILYQIDTARITTIDSFCSGLLREYALWMEDDPDYTLMSESDMALLPKRIAQNTLVALLDKQDEIALKVATELGITNTVDQLVSLLNQPNLHDLLLQYANGNTNTIIEQWRETLHTHIQEDAQAYRVRLQSLEDVIDDNSHKYEICRQLLSSIFINLATNSSSDSIKDSIILIEELNFKGARIRKTFDAELYEELKEICKEGRTFIVEMVKPYLNDDNMVCAATCTRDIAVVYTHVYEAYHQHKRANSAKDFSDLLRDALTLLNTQPAIRNQIAGSIRYLMIDEFQDTNPAQWALAQCLMQTESQKGSELFIVGDAKQSIYRFRNADVSVFQEAQKSTIETIQLNTNFRTVPNIMDWINAFFSKSQLLQSVAHPWERLEAHRPLEKEARLTFLLNTQPVGTPAYVQRQTEAEGIANHVAYLISTQNTSFKDIALLFRTKSHIYLYENALKAKGIPYVVLGGTQFFHRQEISDIMNLLQAVLDPWHEEALYGWLRSPMVALSDDSLVSLTWQQGLAKQFYSDATVIGKEQQARLNQARQWIAHFRTIAQGTVSELLQSIINTTHYEGILFGLPHGEQRLRNIQKLLDTARDMTQSGKLNLHEFMQFLEEQRSPGVLEGDAPLMGEQQNAVTLMTVHASKGLEYPVVILPDTSTASQSGSREYNIKAHANHGICLRPSSDDGANPAMYNFLKALDEDEDRQEDARVLYVAMTRAKDRLIISGTRLQKFNDDGEITEVKVAGKSSWLASFADEGIFNLLNCESNWQGTYEVIVDINDIETSPLTVSKEVLKQSIPDGDFSPISFPERPTNFISTTSWLDQHFPGPDHSNESDFNPTNLLTLQRGTVVHRYLEVWDFDKDSPPNIENFLTAEFPAQVDNKSIAETLSHCANTLINSELYALLRENGPLQRELPFVTPHDGHWISGTIDMLTADGTIIDYKTGRYREEKLSRYESQLRLYAQALKHLSNTPPTAAWIYFVDSGTIHQVSF